MRQFALQPLALDAGATGADAAQNGSPFQNMAGQMLIGVGLFLLVVYIVYLLYKYLLPGRNSKVGFGFNKNKHTRVLEITSVGPGSTIQLVRVSEEYFLIGVTKNQISFLTKTSPPPNADEIPAAGGAAFDSFLNRFKKPKSQPGEGNGDDSAGTGGNGL